MAGSILASSLFEAASAYFSCTEWKIRRLKIENAALQGKAAVENAFIRSVENGEITEISEFEADAEAKGDPHVCLSEDILQKLNENNADVIVDAEIIDQNYSDLFSSEAGRLEIPRAEPFRFVWLKTKGSPVICMAKKFWIRTRARNRTLQNESVSFSESILVILDPCGGIHAVPLYTKKQ